MTAAATIEAQTAATPFVKWAGGKRVLAPEILRQLPQKIGTYYEPFVGGGAVFFALAAEKRFKRAVLCDMNTELVEAYEMIRDAPGSVVIALRRHAIKHSEDYYYRMRASSGMHDSVKRAARMIYMNRTCFNGLYRVNRKGEFNVPFGDYANPTICDAENLRAVSVALQGVALRAGDFEMAVAGAKKGDAVYFDPPYIPTSETASFTAYAKGGFRSTDQERLRDVAAKLVKRGVHVLLSNSDTPAARELYSISSVFKIETVSAPRRINSKGGKRGNVGELLISGISRRTR